MILKTIFKHIFLKEIWKKAKLRLRFSDSIQNLQCFSHTLNYFFCKYNGNSIAYLQLYFSLIFTIKYPIIRESL